MRNMLAFLTLALLVAAPAQAIELEGEYVADKGFVLRSTDGNNEIVFGGYFQVRYEYQWLRKFSLGSLNPPGNTNARRFSTFDFRRARIDIRGHVFSPKIQFRAEFDPAVSTDLYQTLYVRYAAMPQLRITAGHMRVPFNRQEITSASKLQFSDRSIISNTNSIIQDFTETDFTFAPQFNLGATLSGHFIEKKIEYTVGVFNGDDNGLDLSLKPADFSREFNPIESDMLYAARVMVSPLGYVGYDEADIARTESPKFAIGAAYYFDDEVEKSGNPIRVDIHGFTADLAVRFQGFSFNGEFHNARFVQTVPGFDFSGNEVAEPEQTFDGYILQAGYILPIPNLALEIAGRYAILEVETDEAYAVNPDQRDNEREYGVAVNWYVTNSHNFKIVADYLVSTTEFFADREDARRRQARLQMQVRL